MVHRTVALVLLSGSFTVVELSLQFDKLATTFRPVILNICARSSSVIEFLWVDRSVWIYRDRLVIEVFFSTAFPLLSVFARYLLHPDGLRWWNIAEIRYDPSVPILLLQ